MPRRLPAVRRLADELRAARVGRTQTVADSVEYLAAHRGDLQRWQDIEELALDALDDEPSPGAQALAHHLLQLREVLASELYSREIFVGASVLDDLLFFAASSGPGDDPLLAALEFLRDRRVNRPGLVLLPLHGFGIIAAGLTHALTQRRLSVLRPEWDLALTPQTNDMSKTIAWLEQAREALGVRKRIPAELLRHFRRSRAPWLDRNPLLAVRVVNVAGAPYENQRLLMSRVRAATGLLALVASQQPDNDEDPVRLFSTSRTNNFETLDIHHYVVLSDSPGQPSDLEGWAVPLNLDREDVYELTDLSVQLDPRLRAQRRTAFLRIERAVQLVYDGYLRHSYGSDDGGTRGRVYRKAFDSLNYFRRSERAGGGAWSATVSLAIAFEMLLTDSYGRGVTEQIVRRAGLVLSGVPYRREHERNVRALFAIRGNIVHRGSVMPFDLRPGRRTYAAVFSRLAPLLPSVRPQWTEPLRKLTGDDNPDRDGCQAPADG
jgi:hypothetical protein